MASRPTAIWRLGADDTVVDEFHPPDLIARTDEVLDAFDNKVAQLDQPSDEDVLAAIRDVVLALNTVDGRFEFGFETDEREMLCGYIDEVLTEAGIDLDAVSRRQRIPRDELTDAWRTW